MSVTRTETKAPISSSDLVSFSVADIPGSDGKRIQISYDDPEKHYGALMIGTLDLGSAFRDDFLLMSVDDNAELNSEEKLSELRRISDEADNKPILIKKGDQVIVYGNSEGMKWKPTTLDSTPFGNLSFPEQKNEAVTVKKGAITPEMYAEVMAKKGHTLVLEQSMTYSEITKEWSVILDRPMPADVRGRFFFFPNVTPATALADKINTPPVHDTMIAVENGRPHPWIYPDPSIAKGTFQKFIYKNGALTAPADDKYELKDGERFITLYLPPGYDPNRKPPYHLQIALDGDDMNRGILQLHTTLDNLIAAKKMEPTVVAFVPFCDGGPVSFGSPEFADTVNKRCKEYSCNPETADKLAALPATLCSLSLNVNPSRETTTITGISLSAQQAGIQQDWEKELPSDQNDAQESIMNGILIHLQVLRFSV